MENNMKPHAVIDLDPNKKGKYYNACIDDILAAAIITGYFDVNGVRPLHTGLFYGKKYDESSGKRIHDNSRGFIDLDVRDADYFEAKYVKLDELSLQDRIVITPSVEFYEIENKQCVDFIKKEPRMVIIPIRMPGHFTVLILEPQQKPQQRAYYYDSFGSDNEDVRQLCEKELGYKYEYNNKKLQNDGISCGPSVVNFVIHTIESVKNDQRISAEGMPMFGYDPLSSINQKIVSENMLQVQRDLLYFECPKGHKVPFQTDFFQRIMEKATRYLVGADRTGKIVPGAIELTSDEKYMFEHEVHKEIDLNSAATKNRNGYALTTFVGVVLGITAGTILGWSMQENKATSFLGELLEISSQQAGIIFTVSTCVAMGVIFGIIGNLVGKTIDTI